MFEGGFGVCRLVSVWRMSVGERVRSKRKKRVKCSQKSERRRKQMVKKENSLVVW
jgi:hypothetical protein